MFEQLGQIIEGISLSDTLIRHIISTLLLVVGLSIGHSLLARFIRRTVTSIELRRKWLVQSRNGYVLLVILGLLLIWGSELRTLALSIVALAVAFVVATKELILCVTGSILKSGSRAFNLGDRIQIKDFRGDVIDQNLLATTILEVGPGKIAHQRTGRVIVIPNALFVLEPLINENFTRRYSLHVFIVPFKREDDWQAARRAILTSAQHHCAPHLEKARLYMSRIGEAHGLDVPSVEPRVTLQVPSAGEIHLVVRVPVKSAERSFIEQAILEEVFGNKAPDDGEKEQAPST